MKEIEHPTKICDDALLLPSSLLNETPIDKKMEKLDGLEKARELLTGILNQLVFLDYPMNEVEDGTPQKKNTSRQIHSRWDPADVSIHTMASTRTSMPSNIGMKRMGHGSLVELCSNAIESSVVPPSPIQKEIENHPSDEDTDLLCNMLQCPSLPILSNNFLNRDVFDKTPAVITSPEKLPPSEDEVFSNFSSLDINPSFTSEEPMRIHMFGSEYARFLCSTPFSPKPRKKSLFKVKRFYTPPSINLEDASDSIVTGAVTDMIVTHGNESPPRGFYRISKSSQGQDGDFGEGIYLNVKKEGNWDRAVQRPYITSICVIFPDREEFVPPGYCVVRHKDLPANLNHGTKAERVYLCFKRSREGNPITGILPLQPSNGEEIPEGYTVLERTPRNYVADVNSSGPPIFIAIRQRLANLETLRPFPLIGHVYYCTGATVVSSKLGKCHVMDRSRHPMISPSSVAQRLLLIQESRDRSRHPMISPSSVAQRLLLIQESRDRSFGSTYDINMSSSIDCESISSNLLIQSMEHFDTTILTRNTPYVDAKSPYLDFIPVITNENGSKPADLPSVLVLTPILTACYTHHGGVARLAIESLSFLLNHTDFFNIQDKQSDSHTLLDLSLQVVCDVATSSSRETIFQPCVDFVRDALKMRLNTRSLGYAFRMFLFVFYFGASMPNSSFHFNVIAEMDGIGAPQSAALALKHMITTLLSRLPSSPPKPTSTHFIQSILTDLINSAITTVDITNYTQITIHQIQRSGGSELFWHEMITFCGEGLFDTDTDYIVVFAILASIVKICSGGIRYMNHEAIPRDVNTKLLSLELLLCFLKNCKIDVDAAFHSPPSILAYTIRRLVVPCLINNTISIQDIRIFRRILNIITELWRFRYWLKVELAVLLDHFLICILKLGPQVTCTKRNCITLQHQIEVLDNVWFQNPSDIMELYLNYDMEDNLKWQSLCNCLCNFAEQCGIVIAELIHWTRENRVEVGNVEEVRRKREAARSLQAKSLEVICKIARILLEACYFVENEDFGILESLTKSDSWFFGSSTESCPSFHTEASRNSIQRANSKTSNGLKEKQADQRKTEESLKVAFEILEDRGLKKALDYLVACNIVTPSPRDIASFLRIHQSKIDPSILGDYLSEGGIDDGEYWNLIRYHFIRAISFAAMDVEQGLRHLLTRCGFILPGEAQKIDRILSTFAQCYWEDNAGDHVKCPFRHQDTVYLLSYAIIMLNTDLHKANSVHPSHTSAASSQTRSLSRKRGPRRMSTQDFISNLRGTDSEDLCKDYLTSIYESVERNPIKFLTSQKNTISNRNSNQSTTSSHASSINFSSDRSCSNSSTNSVRMLTKSIKPSLELLRSLADQKHTFHCLQDDDSLYSKDFLKLIIHSVWHHFYGIVNGTLDAVQLDPQGVFACLQILQNTICMTIVLDMDTEKHAFVMQLARIKFLMERGLEDGASRVYSRSVKEANFIVGDEFKHEKWYQQLEKLCTSTNRMDAVQTVVRTVEQLKRAMPIDGNVNIAMKRVTDLIRNGGILLNNPTRSFVFDGDLTKKSSRSGRSTVYRFFLFSDVLLYAHKSSKGDYKVHESLLLHMMKISDVEITKKHPHGFQIHHPRKSFVAFASSLEVKKMWLDLLASSIRSAVERKAGFEGATLAASASIES